MAELKKIEDMAHAINYRQPKWIEGVEVEKALAHKINDGGHTSGQLRNIADEIVGWPAGTATGTLEYDAQVMRGLHIMLMELAEKFDDAHQEWLEADIRSRIRRYIVIGNIPDMETEIVVYDNVEDGGHAERKFSAALDAMIDEEEITTPGYQVDFLLEIDGDGSVFYCQDQFGFHGNTREEAK